MAKTGYPKVEKLTIKYRVEITTKEMLKVLDKDLERDLKDTLYYQLQDLRYVITVDYDGHFGPYVFIEIAVIDDTNENWREILSIIENYLKG